MPAYVSFIVPRMFHVRYNDRYGGDLNWMKPLYCKNATLFELLPLVPTAPEPLEGKAALSLVLFRKLQQ
ncbi:hypothetical protein CBM2589_A70304 [Cupriavidus taiwanensis]|uniref:Uncharacterized protein n=1 Tax=Cupriavidus taiwanensis TaxID=164546 RepID=A0A375C7C7_9BURK|nr:hypothetical protein CBM2589_A70304 [Cupriavidus taiwanensis]